MGDCFKALADSYNQCAGDRRAGDPFARVVLGFQTGVGRNLEEVAG